MIDTLLIGYGNSLRGDDGVGPRVAEAVAGWNRPGLQAIAVQQLLPELAASLATVRRVILVDASVDTETVQIQSLRPSPIESALGHAPEPCWLLSLTAQLYDRCPEAWLITIPAQDLGFGEELSLRSRQGMETALGHIDRLTSLCPSRK
jgi:hydrogenase maturation protease